MPPDLASYPAPLCNLKSAIGDLLRSPAHRTLWSPADAELWQVDCAKRTQELSWRICPPRLAFLDASLVFPPLSFPRLPPSDVAMAGASAGKASSSGLANADRPVAGGVAGLIRPEPASVTMRISPREKSSYDRQKARLHDRVIRRRRDPRKRVKCELIPGKMRVCGFRNLRCGSRRQHEEVGGPPPSDKGGFCSRERTARAMFPS